MSVFTVVNDDVLLNAIQAAQNKLVLVAPGVSEKVAEALGMRFKEIGQISITVILDVDAEVCRLGYGEIAGLQKIKEHADQNLLELRHQPGVRIGLLISDTDTLIYAPIPLLIEAGSNQPEKPNAIVLRNSPLSPIERAIAVETDSLPFDAEIGKQVVLTEQIVKVANDLKENPPKEFDIARAERVFNSRIQYVEFKVGKYKLSSKIAKVPTELMGLNDDADLQDRWRNSFRIFKNGQPFEVSVPELDEEGEEVEDKQGNVKSIKYCEKELERERAGIVKDYLFVVPNFDTVLLRSRRSEFDRRVKHFEIRVAHFKVAVLKKLEGEIDKSIKKLVGYLMERSEMHSLPRYRKASPNAQVQDDELKEMLTEDLKKEFGKMDKLFSPNIVVRFKDVTYESIHNGEFHDALKKVMPARTVEKLFGEYDAAPQKKS